MIITLANFNKITPVLWEIPKAFRKSMLVPARIYATERMLEEMCQDRSLEQLVNVTAMPGIQKWALAMPDTHEGYGFPVGGVAAFDITDGVISPGAIGYDINCGVRLLKTNIAKQEAVPYLTDLGSQIFNRVPSGVGQGGQFPLEDKVLDQILLDGAEAIFKLGYAEQEDLEHIESHGKLVGANPELVSEYAKERGRNQLGTLGAGNHFIEIGYVEKIFDSEAAQKLGLILNQLTVLIHTGSRGLGHQVATDYMRRMDGAMASYGILLSDRELACAPFYSQVGQEYFAAMKAAANFAWANRQLITFEVRRACEVVWQKSIELAVVFDIAHNIAKLETYKVGDCNKELLVHRKGATRAFPGQPVIIPGSMGSASYVLLGQHAALVDSFGSCCHGAGRRLSRTQARKQLKLKALYDDLATKGITVHAGTTSGLVEEAPQAYKDIEEVVQVIQEAGIAKKTARLRPLVVVKG